MKNISIDGNGAHEGVVNTTIYVPFADTQTTEVYIANSIDHQKPVESTEILDGRDFETMDISKKKRETMSLTLEAPNSQRPPEAFKRYSYPVDAPCVAAAVTVGNLIFRSKRKGESGNDFSVTFIDPGANSQALKVKVEEGTSEFIAYLQTDNAGALIGLDSEIKAKFEAHPAFQDFEIAYAIVDEVQTNGTDITEAAERVFLDGGESAVFEFKTVGKNLTKGAVFGTWTVEAKKVLWPEPLTYY